MTRARQKITLILLSVILFFGATIVLFFLKRISLPARLVLAAVDYAAAAAMLLYIRQRFGKDPE